jgi:hypothetical protein
MPYDTTIDTNILQKWIAARMEPKAVEEALLASGYDETAINSHLNEYRRLKNAKRLFEGFVCMGVGAFLGFISCVLTLINAVPALYAIILYGLTSLAILVILVGLYFVFE